MCHGPNTHGADRAVIWRAAINSDIYVYTCVFFHTGDRYDAESPV